MKYCVFVVRILLTWLCMSQSYSLYVIYPMNCKIPFANGPFNDSSCFFMNLHFFLGVCILYMQYEDRTLAP